MLGMDPIPISDTDILYRISVFDIRHLGIRNLYKAYVLKYQLYHIVCSIKTQEYFQIISLFRLKIISLRRIKTDYWFYTEAIIVSEKISLILISYSLLVIVSS